MRHVLLIVLLAGLACAQQKPVKGAVPAVPVAIPVITDETVYPLPLALRDEIRDLQHEDDQLEIENQKMLLKIEQNKARQAGLVDRETIIATEYARSKNLDLAQIEMDPAKIALRKKKGK